MKNKTVRLCKLLCVSMLSISTMLTACNGNVSIEETATVSDTSDKVPSDTDASDSESKDSDRDALGSESKDSDRDASGSESKDSDTDASDSTDNASDKVPSDSQDAEEEDDEPISDPESNEDLYNLLMTQLGKGKVEKVYPYVSDTIQLMFPEDSFKALYGESLSPFGVIKEVQEESHDSEDNYDHYKGKLIYEHVECAYDITLRNKKIENIHLNPFFTGEFDQTLENGATEHYFALESGKYRLNAAYVKASNENAPTVLLVAKAGATDYNGLVGTRPILKDLAWELAERGISSLRIEKRFYRYSADWKETDGLDEDYFEDYTSALEWLKKQDGTQKVWLLGHDGGGNIAAELTERVKVDGLVFMNGSARHLAEILVDTLGMMSTDQSFNEEFVETLKSITHENAQGMTYNATSDYYCADYNELDTISSLKKSGVPTLIVNSKDDEQLFDADYALWEKEFGDDPNVTLTFLENIDHFGYEKSSDPLPYYKVCNFSDTLADTIAEFVKTN